MMARRIALSMRVMQTSYGEYRDALAQDWGRFLARALPDVAWLPVPNIGPAAVGVLKNFAVDGLILTGGDDWGMYPQRDETEISLLEHLVGEMPVLGVCRGAQVVNRYCGGNLVKMEGHVASRHQITWQVSDWVGRRDEVNSYHNFAITGDSLGKGLKPFAIASDGSIESFGCFGRHCLAIMWHPEREQSPAEHDVRLFRDLFGPDNSRG